MKLKHLKKFEHFNNAEDMGRFSQMDSDEQEWLTRNKKAEEEEEIFNPENDEESEEESGECPTCNNEGCPECDHKDEEESEEEMSDEPRRRKVWGDEVIEKKKFNFEKGKKDDKKSEKKDDKKEDKKENKKGLTAAQKKLPEGLRKAIEAKKKK